MTTNRKITVVSWNVRGLGDVDKCDAVRDAFTTSHPLIACVQETKLSDIPDNKFKSFLPAHLASHCFLSADGSRGGLATAWDENHFTLLSSVSRAYPLTTTFSYATADFTFTLTNVYAPSDHRLSPDFLLELRDLYSTISGPWMTADDFNLIRSPNEKSNDNFDASLADAFNTTVHDLLLLELPLLDRLFTWSNKRDSPVLARLDRVFFNGDFEVAIPNTTLTSLSHATSDHTPLLITMDTSIPKTHCFRFENGWLHDSSFLPAIRPVWHALTDYAGDVAGALATRLKDTRRAAKT